MQKSTFTKAFEVLQDREAFFKNVSNQSYTTKIIGTQVLLIGVLCFSYGVPQNWFNRF